MAKGKKSSAASKPKAIEKTAPGNSEAPPSGTGPQLPAKLIIPNLEVASTEPLESFPVGAKAGLTLVASLKGLGGDGDSQDTLPFCDWEPGLATLEAGARSGFPTEALVNLQAPSLSAFPAAADLIGLDTEKTRGLSGKPDMDGGDAHLDAPILAADMESTPPPAGLTGTLLEETTALSKAWFPLAAKEGLPGKKARAKKGLGGKPDIPADLPDGIKPATLDEPVAQPGRAKRGPAGKRGLPLAGTAARQSQELMVPAPSATKERQKSESVLAVAMKQQQAAAAKKEEKLAKTAARLAAAASADTFSMAEFVVRVEQRLTPMVTAACASEMRRSLRSPIDLHKLALQVAAEVRPHLEAKPTVLIPGVESFLDLHLRPFNTAVNDLIDFSGAMHATLLDFKKASEADRSALGRKLDSVLAGMGRVTERLNALEGRPQPRGPASLPTRTEQPPAPQGGGSGRGSYADATASWDGFKRRHVLEDSGPAAKVQRLVQRHESSQKEPDTARLNPRASNQREPAELLICVRAKDTSKSLPGFFNITLQLIALNIPGDWLQVGGTKIREVFVVSPITYKILMTSAVNQQLLLGAFDALPKHALAGIGLEIKKWSWSD